MEQYVDSSFGFTPIHPIIPTENLFVLVKEEECNNQLHVGYVYAFADTEAGIKAQKHISELMKQEDSYDLDLWTDAMADIFGVDMVWAPVVRNDRLEFDAVVWA